MTPEKEMEGFKSESLNVCECVFFEVLSPADQEENRKFRQAAEAGEEPPGIHNSLCGPCITRKKIQKQLLSVTFTSRIESNSYK
jgi:hypothetical protein